MAEVDQPSTALAENISAAKTLRTGSNIVKSALVEPLRSSSAQPAVCARSFSKQRCGCQSKYDIEMRAADGQVQRCLRMLKEILKLKSGFHTSFYLMDVLKDAQEGPRVTGEYESSQATLQEALVFLDVMIRTKVGKAFLKRSKQPALESEAANEPTTDQTKVRLTRKARNTARQLFDSESSISLDLSEFNNRDQARRTESMLKDYVAAQEAMIEMAAKLAAMANEPVVLDGGLANHSPAFG